MKYNGIELTEFTSDKPVAFDSPKAMLVRDKDYDTPAKVESVEKHRRATNRELAQWIAKGNGETCDKRFNIVDNGYSYHTFEMDNPCPSEFKIRKWSDEEWHEPTLDYMALEE